MAEEKKDEAKKEEATEQPQAPQENKLFGLIAALISLISLGVSLALVYFATYGFVPPTVTEAEVYEEYQAKRLINADEPAIYTLDSFSVNLSGRPKRSIRIQISLHKLSEDGFEEVGELDAEARDLIVRLLSSKNFSDLETIQGKLFLKQQIAANLNGRLQSGVIKEVYFNDFLIR